MMTFYFVDMGHLDHARKEIDAIQHGGQLDDERLERIVSEIIQCASDPIEMAENILDTVRGA